MDSKYRLFRRNQTIIDLGYAPGSWSQVAVERTRPHGVVVGIDLIPAQPPRGVTSIQGDFLSPQVRKLVRDVMVEQVRRKKQERALERKFDGMIRGKGGEEDGDVGEMDGGSGEGEGEGEGEGGGKTGEVVQDRPSYIDLEKAAALDIEAVEAEREDGGRMVDVSSCFYALEKGGEHRGPLWDNFILSAVVSTSCHLLTVLMFSRW